MATAQSSGTVGKGKKGKRGLKLILFALKYTC